ncbi:unnamed protein product, partial [Prorocentrum cordatum]
TLSGRANRRARTLRRCLRCAPGRPAPAHGRARGWSGRVGRRGGRRRRGGARARRGHACPCLCRGAAVCACRWRTKGGEGGGEGGGEQQS